MEYISLLALNKQIKTVLSRSLPSSIWITAELTEIQNNSSGHCYLQLAEKREEDDTLLATARATIWASTYRLIRSHFVATTGRELAKGMKILIKVEVIFHEVYGFSLNVKDIEPTFTLGDIERRRREIIERLTKEGIIDLNRELEFPLLPKRIAVISSATAAGYGDFIHQLENNSYKYKFHITLFPTVMQGDKTSASVLNSLSLIANQYEAYDVVVIIRGGGAQQELASFDNYEIAASIATFPLPVIAGIGHERDETIVDRVAYLKVKTPTAAAAFLIEAFAEQEGFLDACAEQVKLLGREVITQHRQQHCNFSMICHQIVTKVLQTNELKLSNISQNSEHLVKQRLLTSEIYLNNIPLQIENKTQRFYQQQQHTLERLEQNIKQLATQILNEQNSKIELFQISQRLADPRNILQRGFSVTRVNGKAITNCMEVADGDIIETQLMHGTLTSKITQNINEL
ncbi:MAG: exodeoxyribonuclease VII large subunit [Marinifilaceae bacterium]